MSTLTSARPSLLKRIAASIGMVALVVTLPLAASPAAAADEPVRVTSVTTDGASNPLGVDTTRPNLGWQLESSSRGVTQGAYQVRVSDVAADPAVANLWDSGRVDSAESTNVAYDGAPLESQSRYYWQVRVWDAEGVESAWSDPAWFETAILDPAEWEADWIGAPGASDRLNEWTDYTVTTDFTLVSGTAFGVFVRAATGANNFMWQLNDETPGDPKLRPHVRNNGGFALLGEVSLTAAGLPADVLKNRATVAITVDGSTITTRINDVVVDTRTDARHPQGFVGIRTNQSTTATESVVLHSMTVENETSTLLDTDFATENPFSSGELVAGGVEFTGNHEAFLSFDENYPLLRTEFSVDKEVASARISATARGIYELSLNGEKVGDQVLAPGWTDFDSRIHFQTYDVTDQIAAGDNALGGMIAPGWYSGRLAHVGAENYGTRESLIAQLRIEYTDGTSEIVGTNDGWMTAPGPFEQADNIDGETHDARAEIDGWNTVGFDDSAWAPVWVAPSATDKLQAQPDEAIRETEVLPAIGQTEPEAGKYVYDLGQNMVGVVRVTLRGEPGETVTLRYAEELNRDDGTMYTANLRSAKATDYYTFDEKGEVVYEPTFTFHGFRYLEISGTDQPPALDEVTGRVWGSDLAVTGELETSNAMLNQLQSNIVWGQRGNFLSIPTDTPARDERMGWSGDINVFAPTASYNMDTLGFLSKWVVDLQDAQLPNGDYHGVAPYHPNLACCGGGTGWSDAGITVPYALWQSYGSTDHIREGWASMTRFMDYLETNHPSGIRGSSYADWLNLDDPTPGDVLGTAYYSFVSNQMSEMAAAIGETADAAHYAELHERVSAVFTERYVAADGTVTGDSQAAYAIAIGMGLVPDEVLPAAADKFEATIARRDYHLSTGFLGTPWLVSSLAESGKLDVAYRLLMNDTFPSWGYEVAMGATTMWERWSSILPDGSFTSDEYPQEGMNSFNHYAYGAIGDWMYRSIGGIAPGAAGYKHTVVEPIVGGGLTSASASYDSVYGTIDTAWEQTGESFALDVAVPANTTATVVLPTSNSWAVLEGGVPAADADGVTDVSVADGSTRIEIGSGTYSFTVDPDGEAVGAVLDAIIALGESADELAESGDLDTAVHETVSDAVDGMSADARTALEAALAGDRNDAIAALAEVLVRLDALESDLDDAEISPASRAELDERVADVRRALGAALSRFTGVISTLRLTGDTVLPGGSIGLELTLENTSTEPIDDITAAVSSANDWTVEPAENSSDGPLAAGETATFAFSAEVPDSVTPDQTERFDGIVDFTADGIELQSASTVTATALSPLTLGDPTVAPSPAAADATVEITVPVTNASASPITTDIVVDVPAAWGADVHSGTVVVPAASSTDVAVTVPTPATISEIEYVLPLAAVRGEATYDTATAGIPIDLPTVQHDWVDLGNGPSESAHAVVGSPSSGTSSEAGLSRRYSHGGVADSWFEMTVAVPTDGAFRVRATETYERAQAKEYFVTADGVPVHERVSAPTGAGAVSYEFDVDQADVSADGQVVLRFQRTAGSVLGDPSIADVWIYDDAVSDHIDLGFGFSETAHALTAAPSSATTSEAGLTRRYSGVNTPGSWFEFDLAVPAGEPVLLRGIETYDGPQHKQYDVIVDGQVFDARSIPRTETGPGLREYQVLVDDTSLTADGVVRVRMQKTNTGPEFHDPSIADVWALAAPADTVAPVVAATLGDGGLGRDGWARGAVGVTLTASDNRDAEPTIEFRVDAGEWTTYEAPFEVTGEGEHSVEYRATDAAANVSEVGVSTLRIDSTPPTATVVVAPDAVEGWLPAGATATLDAQDAGSGIRSLEYRIGDGSWTAYDAPLALPNGEITLHYRATDIAGNLGTAESIDLRVDGAAASVTAEVDGTLGSAGWYVDEPTVTLEVTDADSGVASLEYRLGGGEWLAYDGGFTLGDGQTVVSYRATDVAGNVSTVESLTVSVDTSQPTVVHSLTNDRSLSIVATDELSGIASVEYQLGDDEWAVYSAPLTIGSESLELRYRATDVAGNTSDEYSMTLVGGSLSATVLAPGGSVTVTGAGFEPGETVRIELQSAPVLLETVTADANGEFSARVTIPESTTAGAHAIVLIAESGAEVRLAVEIAALVIPGTHLPLTGALVAPWLTLGGLLAAAGIGLVILRRRRAGLAE